MHCASFFALVVVQFVFLGYFALKPEDPVSVNDTERFRPVSDSLPSDFVPSHDFLNYVKKKKVLELKSHKHSMGQP